MPIHDPVPARPIPVICDRCRAEGCSGADPFAAFGDLLDFDPVPRRNARADGWDAEVQRAYIAALSLTGSDRAACRAVGKSAFGVTQLLAHPDSASFAAARDEALAIAADERSRRLAEGLQAIAAEQAGWRPADPPWSRGARGPGRPPAAPALPGPARREAGAGRTEAEEEEDVQALRERFERLVNLYLIKVESEREARLAGRIVAADFYLRQLTCMEVMVDLADVRGGFRALEEARRHGLHPVEIAETPFSRILGIARREKWAELGEPPRPEHPPRRYLVPHGEVMIEPRESIDGRAPGTFREKEAARDERYRADARAQLEWEAQARRDYERRRDSGAAS